MTPVDRFINTLTLQTYAWIEAGAQQVRQWREEDENNGIIWNQSPREPDANSATGYGVRSASR